MHVITEEYTSKRRDERRGYRDCVRAIRCRDSALTRVAGYLSKRRDPRKRRVHSYNDQYYLCFGCIHAPSTDTPHARECAIRGPPPPR